MEAYFVLGLVYVAGVIAVLNPWLRRRVEARRGKSGVAGASPFMRANLAEKLFCGFLFFLPVIVLVAAVAIHG